MAIKICAIGAFFLCAALAGAFLGERVAHAQGDNDHVDVGLVLEYPDRAGSGARDKHNRYEPRVPGPPTTWKSWSISCTPRIQAVS